MQLLNELNKKWWYRLIKVFYIIIFVGIFLLGNFLIYDNGVRELDKKNTKVICYSMEDRFFTNPKNHLTFSLDDVGIEYINENYIDGYYINYKEYLYKSTHSALKSTIFCINQVNKNNDNYKVKDIKNYNNTLGDMYVYQKSYELRYGINKIGNFTYNTITGEVEGTKMDKLKEKVNDYIEYVNSDVTELEKINKLDFSIKMFDIKINYSYSKFILSILGFILGLYITFELIKRIFYYIVLGTFLPKKNK